jgi:hypothetical protein
MAETLASQGRQRPLDVEYSPFVGGKDAGVRLGLAVDTLLGPEGTSTPHVLGLFVSSGQSHASRDTGPWWVLVVWMGGVGVGCCLRIAQWTRASLWSSCRGRTVDALAPGADEGRGRPR